MNISNRLIVDPLLIANLPAGGVIGTAVNTVDKAAAFKINQTTANQTITLPLPTVQADGTFVRVQNSGTVPFTMYGTVIGINQFGEFETLGNTWQSQAASSAAADFWRSAAGATTSPDGTTDITENIRRNGNVGLNVDPTTTLEVDSLVVNDSGFALRKLNPNTTPTSVLNTMAIGVDPTGKVVIPNAVGSADTRNANDLPQDFTNAGSYFDFKDAAVVGMTVAAGVIPAPSPYVGVNTFRKYGQASDMSGGQIRQEAYLDDGRKYYRMSTSATTWGSWTQIVQKQRNLQDRFSSQAATKISLNGEIRWVGFYHIMTTGTNSVEPSGYFRIDMPADGFAVPVAGGGTRAVVAATAGSSIATGGIPLNAWDTLYYKHVSGSAPTSVPANFLIVPYTVNTNALDIFLNSNDYIMVAKRDDASVFTLGTGDVVGLCSQTGRGGRITSDAWSAMKQRAMGEGYFFCPGGNSAIPVVFGFTGAIRWIDSGSTPNVNSSGYFDSTSANRAVGAAVGVVNGAAARSWRLMTAAEKPAWFGGALRGVHPIVPTSTTVVDLNDNETLFLVPNIDNPTVTPQFVISGYSGAVTVPCHWMPIASRQTTGANSTIQILVGGVQKALRAGDAHFMTTPADHETDALHRNKGITHKGLKHGRWLTSTFFSGTTVNGILGSATGIAVSWDDNTLIYGISDGYASWGNGYNYINVPAANFQIPVVNVGSNVTRQIQTIGGRRFVPLGVWEALYYIPPAYSGGGGSFDSDFVIAYYGGNSLIPTGAIMVAKYEGAVSSATGISIGKNRVRFADGTYIQAGYGSPPSLALSALYDQSHNTGEWRNVTVAGSTPPAATAALPAVAGVVANYSAPYTCQYRNLTLDDDPRGAVEIVGIIQLSASITGSPNIAFISGANVLGEPIISVPIAASTVGDAKMVNGQVRFVNGVVGGQNGVFVRAYADSFNTAVNPYFTLGVNGAASPAGGLLWVSLNNIRLPCA
jgi:hypothetical protein